jgi:hypothetical protein
MILTDEEIEKMAIEQTMSLRGYRMFIRGAKYARDIYEPKIAELTKEINLLKSELKHVKEHSNNPF